MIYTDGIHLVADTLEELHLFAKQIGLKFEWFQNKKKHPHYDIFNSKLDKALLNGAIFINKRDIINICKKLK